MILRIVAGIHIMFIAMGCGRNAPSSSVNDHPDLFEAGNGNNLYEELRRILFSDSESIALTWEDLEGKIWDLQCYRSEGTSFNRELVTMTQDILEPVKTASIELPASPRGPRNHKFRGELFFIDRPNEGLGIPAWSSRLQDANRLTGTSISIALRALANKQNVVVVKYSEHAASGFCYSR